MLHLRERMNKESFIFNREKVKRARQCGEGRESEERGRDNEINRELN
jgi:hypothetical protein